MGFCFSVCLLASLFIASSNAANFTIINGQILTPGLAIVDAPQPFTPLGGDNLQVALDISGNGKLAFPPTSNRDTATHFNNITIYLYSYTTGLNLTISNGTATLGNGSLGDILAQEPSSTVKHVNWRWPGCLVGNGRPIGKSQRGEYNISIHQNYRLNNTDFFTIFDLPIEITNFIPENSKRVSCISLNNKLISSASLTDSMNRLAPDQFPFANGNGIQTSLKAVDDNGISDGSNGGGIGSGGIFGTGSDGGSRVDGGNGGGSTDGSPVNYDGWAYALLVVTVVVLWIYGLTP